MLNAPAPAQAFGAFTSLDAEAMHPCEPSQPEELTEKLLRFFKGAAPKNPAFNVCPRD